MIDYNISKNVINSKGDLIYHDNQWFFIQGKGMSLP